LVSPSVIEANHDVWHGIFLEGMLLLDAYHFRASFLSIKTHETFLKVLEDSYLPFETEV
jgi:hypothetical protein